MSGSSEPILRNLQSSDIPAALELSMEAGWNQTGDDWRTLIELAPQGCLALDVNGELASTATLFSYGRQLAWIGMVLTRKVFQGKGFARRLLHAALNLAEDWGIETVKLDATDQGQPLYETLGFRAEQPIERWARSTNAVFESGISIPSSSLSEDCTIADRHAFGADRTELLRSLAEHNRPVITGSSYLLSRPGRLTRYLGPCVASSRETARTLIEQELRTRGADAWSWDLLPENCEAVALARDLAFSPKRRLLRMARGKELRGRETNIYAIAGFELG